MKAFEEQDVKSLLLKHGFKFAKSKGQNFLVDSNITDKIVRKAEIDSSCAVLEIGPGVGALTRKLCTSAAHVTAVELDKRLIPILKMVMSDYNNIDIINADILKLDIVKLAAEKMPKVKKTVCANLPYNITTPALTTLMDADVFDQITVMVQREVAQRMCSEPGSSNYSAFTVYINYHSQPEVLFDVPPQCFVPRPSVYSSVVKMRKHTVFKLSQKEEALFFKIVRASFGQRRKTLANALHAVFKESIDKSTITNIIIDSGFEANTRGETLAIEDFMGLLARFKALSIEI